jgi:uncharacterized protein (TIGR00299 family) protein
VLPNLPSRNQDRLLERGAGHGKLLFFDTPSGIAGDMIIAAMLDLGVPWTVIEGTLAELPLEGVDVRRQSVIRGAIGATHFSVLFSNEGTERSYLEVRELLCGSSLRLEVRQLSLDIFRRLAEAESEVHRIPVDTVQFHEVGAVDAIVDIVGAAACISYLGARVLCSPLPMGSGSVTCQHGELPLPAPATVNCLAGVPTYAAGVEGELVTPTGAAIIATVADGYVRWPDFSPERVGWGAGTRMLADRPNAVRVTLGQPTEASEVHSKTHTLLEANVDDMTGEVAGYALSALLAAGALDAWASPVIMKKGRPGLVVSALCRLDRANEIADVLLRETSSIGVRFTQVSRRELPRRLTKVDTEYGSIPVKVSGEAGSFQQVKPEFEACAHAARKHGIPVRVVVDAASDKARSLLRSFESET